MPLKKRIGVKVIGDFYIINSVNFKTLIIKHKLIISVFFA